MLPAACGKDSSRQFVLFSLLSFVATWTRRRLPLSWFCGGLRRPQFIFPFGHSGAADCINAGCVSGRKRFLSWRTLSREYFRSSCQLLVGNHFQLVCKSAPDVNDYVLSSFWCPHPLFCSLSILSSISLVMFSRVCIFYRSLIGKTIWDGGTELNAFYLRSIFDWKASRL